MDFGSVVSELLHQNTKLAHMLGSKREKKMRMIEWLEKWDIGRNNGWRKKSRWRWPFTNRCWWGSPPWTTESKRDLRSTISTNHQRFPSLETFSGLVLLLRISLSQARRPAFIKEKQTTPLIIRDNWNWDNCQYFFGLIFFYGLAPSTFSPKIGF